jgi:hypothetical protein
MMSWVRCIACLGEIAYKIVVGKPGGKKPLGRCRHRLEDNIKMDIKGAACEDVD